MQITCPDCELKIQIPENAKIGQIIDCENCGAEIEIRNLNPIVIELVEDEK
jgi:alpha-aminoadipate carrier protein LysW